MSHLRARALQALNARLLLALGISAVSIGCGDALRDDALHDVVLLDDTFRDDTSRDDTSRDDTSRDEDTLIERTLCAESTPIVIRGEPTGFARCVDHPSLVHRVEPLACPIPPPTPLPHTDEECSNWHIYKDLWPTDAEIASGYCRTDKSCPSNQRCNLISCRCDLPDEKDPYPCGVDADCGAGMICRCEEDRSWCEYVWGCTQDADCPPSSLCVAEDNSACSFGFTCLSPQDTCAVDSDCPNTNPRDQIIGCGQSFDGNSRECTSCGSVGRPFWIDGEARLAQPQLGRGDWRDGEVQPSPACVSSLSAAQRAQRCQRWTEIGLMEHASVAAFARSLLQLMSLGAPHELITATIQAIADETKHARWAFGFASAYGGEAIGPGPLSIERALEGDDIEGFIVATIYEGCVGETVAALEALDDADGEADPVVRRVLTQIAEDETQHAVLAWRTLQWALSRQPSLRGLVVRSFAEASALAPPASLRAQTLEGLALPCLSALLQGAPLFAAVTDGVGV
jgi:hypothetical protein